MPDSELPLPKQSMEPQQLLDNTAFEMGHVRFQVVLGELTKD